MTASLIIRIGNAYDVRDYLREVGGRWNAGAKTWDLTLAQYASIMEDVATSAKRSNKRDTALARGWQSVTVTAVDAIGARVQGGKPGTEDHDTGSIRAIDGTRAEVGWDSGVSTWTDLADLSPA